MDPSVPYRNLASHARLLCMYVHQNAYHLRIPFTLHTKAVSPRLTLSVKVTTYSLMLQASRPAGLARNPHRLVRS